MDATTKPFAVLRWIDDTNAESLGYELGEYPDGQWVIESGATGEHLTDLDTACEQTTMLREIDMDEAKAAARAALTASATGVPHSLHEWVVLPGNYGTAYAIYRA